MKLTQYTKKFFRRLPGYMGLAHRLGIGGISDSEEQERDNFFNKEDKKREVYEKELKKEIREWANTMPEMQRIGRENIKNAINYELEGWKDLYVKSYKNEWPECIKELIKDEILPDVKKARKPKKAGAGGVTDEMVERAKDYPIENLIEVNRFKFARCLGHDDNTPSMYCKNNYAYCFSCGYSADVIKIAMEVWGVEFIDAVKKMQ